MLMAGRVSSFVFTALICAVAIALILLSKKWRPSIRSIPALDALDEAVGRATEMGKPVSFTTGIGQLTAPVVGPMIVAGLSVLGRLTQLCAAKGTQLVYVLAHPEVIPLAYDIMSSAYLAEGKRDKFNPDDSIRFVSDQQFAYTAAFQNFFARERPASSIMIGPFYAESILLSEVGARYGVFQIGGTARPVQIPYFAIVCDFTLIGEEIFAAGAYLSKDPVQLSSIAAQDAFKIVSIILIMFGVVLSVLRSTALTSLLRM